MARRRGHSEEELPFVALMDTMTNVVGVLIIVLVMIGIGLARTVRKVLSELPPVTVEEHAQLTREMEQTIPKLDPQQVAEEVARLQQQIKADSETLETLDLTKEKQPVKMMDLEEVKSQLAAKKKERDERKAAVDRLLAEIDQLKARLDTTPRPQSQASVVVKLPNPRPLPEKAVIQHFLVMDNRVVYTNDEEFAALVETELKKGEKPLVVSSDVVKGPNGKPVMVRDKSGRVAPQKKMVFDPLKLTEFFKQTNLGSREFKIEVPLSPNSPYIPLVLKPEPGIGETAEQAKRLASVFQGLLRKFKADPKSVIWLHVYKDSIPAYLALRELVEQAGLPVGWDLYESPQFVRYLSPDYTVTYTPPPAPTGAQPAVNIAPPKATLD